MGRVVQYLAIAAPCAVFTIVSAWWSVTVPAGRGLWPADEVTLAEAVATRNTGEALRLIQAGADPNRPGLVRDGLLTNGYAVTLRPVEAAVAAQRADSLRVLLANGASVDDEELRVLSCIEQQRHDSGVREILDAHGVASTACDGVRLPTDRTR